MTREEREPVADGGVVFVPGPTLPLLGVLDEPSLPWIATQADQFADETEWLQAALERRELELEAVYDSTSWRITRPVRVLGDLRRRVAKVRSFSKHMTRDRMVQAFGMIAQGDLTGLSERAKAMHRYRTSLSVAQAEPRSAVTVPQSLWPVEAPLISVIVPCFNYGKFLAECLDALSVQTFTSFEVIVVDGGSTDLSSLEAMRNLEDKVDERFRFVYRDGRHLLGCNRNHGISLARGKYVCSLDPDDMVLPIYLEMAAYLLEVENYDVVGSSVQHFGSRTDQWVVRPRPVLSDVIHENVTTSSAVYRRTLWEAAGGYHDTGLGSQLIYEDWKFWVRVMALGARVYNIQAPLFLYRKHEESQSSHRQIPSLQEQREAIATYNADLLTPLSFQRSVQRSSLRYEVQNALANFKQPEPHRKAILICLPFLPRAGAQRIASDVSRQLALRGYRTIVVTTVEGRHGGAGSLEWFKGHTNEIYELPKLLEVESWRNFLTYLIETKNVEAIWQIGSEFIYSELSYLRRRHPHVRVVDSLFILGTHLYKNRENRSFIDVTHVETKVLEKYLLEAGEAPSRVRRIPNGVDIEKWVPSARNPEGLARLSARARDSFIVGFAGRLADEKAPDVFLDIASRFSSDEAVHFVVVGDGPLAEHVRSRAGSRRLRGRVDVVGAVEDPYSLYSCFDVLVLPSILEGRPNVVLECMAMGIPVVASEIAGVPELVAHLQTGYLCRPGDVSAFTAAVRAIANDPAQQRRMSEAAREAASALHPAARSLEAFEDFFQSILEHEAAGNAGGAGLG